MVKKGIEQSDMGEEKKRIEWIDIAKGIAMILVIVGHVFNYGYFVRHAIFSFHLPLFFILAGYTFRAKPWKDLIVSSTKRLLGPFFLLFVLCNIEGILNIVNDPIPVLSKLYYSIGWTPAYIEGTESIPILGIAWFLLCLFIARLAMNAVLKLYERFNVNLIVGAIPVFLIAWGCAWIGKTVLLPLDIDIAGVALLYIYCGFLAKTFQVSPYAKKWYVLAIALVLWIVALNFSGLEMATRRYDNFVLTVVGALAGSTLAIWVSMLIELCPKYLGKVGEIIKRYFVFMGKNSMLVYTLHCFDGCLVSWQSLVFVESTLGYGIVAIIRVVAVSLFVLLVTIV